MFRWSSKLKFLKQILKTWSSSPEVNVRLHLKSLANNLVHVQEKLAFEPFNENIQLEEYKIKMELEDWFLKEEEELRQKSRKLWLKKGDRNSKFFHNAIKIRQSKNNFRHFIKQDGNSLIDIDTIKVAAPTYFKELFNHEHYWNVFPKIIVKRILTDDAISWIQRDVSSKEIKDALFQMDPDKAPGPDGFNAYFYQSNWDILKDDVIKAVKSFFTSGTLLKQLNHTFLSLIPKLKEASSLGDFRPISCCNVSYKIIAKVLSNRLKVVIKELISPNQHAFLEGRNIGDCSFACT